MCSVVQPKLRCQIICTAMIWIHGRWLNRKKNHTFRLDMCFIRCLWLKIQCTFSVGQSMIMFEAVTCIISRWVGEPFQISYSRPYANAISLFEFSYQTHITYLRCTLHDDFGNFWPIAFVMFNLLLAMIAARSSISKERILYGFNWTLTSVAIEN